MEKVLMLKQMDQPVNNQGGTAGPDNSPSPPPPTPGTIITPQNKPDHPTALTSEPRKVPITQAAEQPEPAIKPLPIKAQPVAPAAVPAPGPSHPNEHAATAVPLPPKPPREEAKPPAATLAGGSIPVVAPPPSVEAVPATAPVRESLITAPRLDKRAETKPINPSMNLAPAATKVNKPLPNATLMSAKPSKIIPSLPFELWISIAVATAMALLAIIYPLKTGSANLKHIELAAAILSLLACLGMIFKANWARSIYVSVAIIAIIAQGCMIYQLRNATDLATFTNPKPAGTFSHHWAAIENYIDPKYQQGGERLGLFAGELLAIVLLTTPYMQRVFEQD